MEFFHIPNYFFLQLLKRTFFHKIVGAIAPIAPILTRPLLKIVKTVTHYMGVNDGWAELAIAHPALGSYSQPCIIR
jgi:hypothetical protein